ncbi:hypothetical protein MPL3356_80235 [Mesorhizobium plurifarium]|uniref:Glycosyltransferase 2-like domain-containing protein n=1 Tax=Mesorhizobium plurifarium TaxID=69974 RepID=A0A090GBR8_MESPL|nr:hypothetical protein MPL3356_80235 [Mesorhizobium plurifarium]
MEAVSVIIPAHNAARTIARTLASLVSEKAVIGEVLLVDDSSSDATAAVATETALQFALPMRVISRAAATPAAPGIWRWSRPAFPGST